MECRIKPCCRWEAGKRLLHVVNDLRLLHRMNLLHIRSENSRVQLIVSQITECFYGWTLDARITRPRCVLRDVSLRLESS